MPAATLSSLQVLLVKPKSFHMALSTSRKGDTGTHLLTSEGSLALSACVEGCAAQDSQHWVRAEEGEGGSDAFISKFGTTSSLHRVMQAKWYTAFTLATSCCHVA